MLSSMMTAAVDVISGPCGHPAISFVEIAETDAASAVSSAARTGV